MTEQNAIKAQELLEEIKELKKIDKLLSHEKQNAVNVKFHQHYGECKDYERVEVNKRHLYRFLDVLRKVTKEVEQELEDL